MGPKPYEALHFPLSEWHTLNGVPCHLYHWPGHTGEKILFLHGWLDAAKGFQFVIDALEDHKSWDIYALDWRGMGLSEHQAYGYYDRALMLSDLADLIDIISEDKPIHIVGHSMGGMIAAQYAGIVPNRVKSLVLAEAFGIEDGSIETKALRMKDFLSEIKHPPPFVPVIHPLSFAHKLIKRNPRLDLAKALFLSEGLIKKTEGGWIHRADPKHKIPQPMPYRLDWSIYFWQKITAPVLWLQGEKLSHNFYLRAIEDSYEKRYQAFLSPPVVVLEGVGHMLQWENPEGFANALDAFYSSL